MGAVVWAGAGLMAAAAPLATNVRLRHPAERMAVAQALEGAVARLAGADCRTLLDEFADASGQPLRATLEGLAVDAAQYVQGSVLFYDAAQVACRDKVLAGAAAPGQRVIFVCGRRFVNTMAQSAAYGEAVIIHEMLHSLGLGENPPTSAYITSRIQDRCRR